MNFKKNILWLGATVDLLFLDLFTKWLVRTYLSQPLSIIPGVLQLQTSYNTGIAFSLPIPNTVMVWLAPLAIFGFVFFIIKHCDLHHCATKLSLILIIAGGLGNVINRLWTSAVIDFIDFSFWPNFNLADAYLTVGAFLLVVFYGKIALYEK